MNLGDGPASRQRFLKFQSDVKCLEKVHFGFFAREYSGLITSGGGPAISPGRPDPSSSLTFGKPVVCPTASLHLYREFGNNKK